MQPGDRVRYTERADPRRGPADVGTVVEPTPEQLSPADRLEYPPNTTDDVLVRWDWDTSGGVAWEYRDLLELITP